MVWGVPSNHSTDCYFCMVPSIQNGMSMKKKSILVYPNIPSAIRPVPHGNGLPVPEPPDNFATYSDNEDSMHMRYSSEQWRLFTDASKTSLKAVLLHNGNNLPSISVAYALSTKEMYTTMSNILAEVRYKKYQWEVCGDFKVIAALLGLQAGYTKYSCFPL